MSETTIATIGDESLRSRIYTIRGVQVILAHDLADMYQVSTGVFNQSVKRNEERFPDNFRFQLTKEELEEVITICDNPDRLRFSPVLPFAFTEQGIAMLSGILKSDVVQFNKQYTNSLTVKLTDKFHDRYLIIGNATLIHVGASLNHLGKRCFAFSTMDASFIPDIMARVP